MQRSSEADWTFPRKRTGSVPKCERLGLEKIKERALASAMRAVGLGAVVGETRRCGRSSGWSWSARRTAILAAWRRVARR